MTARLFSIVGDANVRRNMTGLNIASRETMKTAQVIDYLGVVPIEQALAEVRAESSVCIVAAVTELLLSGPSCLNKLQAQGSMSLILRKSRRRLKLKL